MVRLIAIKSHCLQALFRPLNLDVLVAIMVVEERFILLNGPLDVCNDLLVVLVSRRYLSHGRISHQVLH